MSILFKMSSLFIYSENQLKSLSWIDSPCVFNDSRRSLTHNASAISRFCLLLSKFLSVSLKSMVLTFLGDFFMLCFKTCHVSSLPLRSFNNMLIRATMIPLDKITDTYQLSIVLWNDTIITLISLILYIVINFSILYFKNSCWKVTAKILQREIKNILQLVFYFTLKNTWLRLFVIKLYSHTNIFKMYSCSFLIIFYFAIFWLGW